MEDLSGFSVIIPTYCEAKNLPGIVKRFAAIDFGGRPFEVLIVDDDSQDGIAEEIAKWQAQYSWVKLIIRHEARSLSQSVITGFSAALYPFLIVMDADLSHPPEKIIDMLTLLSDSNVDFVVGSRYIPGGSMDEIWPVKRRISSYLAAWLARKLLPTNVRDPLSGFFALRKTAFQNADKLNPIGWKIGLEMMLKCNCKNIQEIPIHFSERLHGKSKLRLKVIIDYLKHVSQLALYRFATIRRSRNEV